MTVDAYKKIKRRNSLRTRRSGVPARTLHIPYRKTISADRIVSFDGLPIGIPGGSESQYGKRYNEGAAIGFWEETDPGYYTYTPDSPRRNTVKMVRFYPRTISYVGILLFIGALLQWVIK